MEEPGGFVLDSLLKMMIFAGTDRLMASVPRNAAATPPAEVGAWLGGRSASSRRVYAAALEAAARAVGRDVASMDWVGLEPATLELIREQVLAAGR